MVHVCWAETEAAARRTAHEWWPNTALKGNLTVDLPTPDDFERAVAMVTEEDVAESVTCGPDPTRHLEAIREYAEAGYDNIYVHQIGPDQEGFSVSTARRYCPRSTMSGRHSLAHRAPG